MKVARPLALALSALVLLVSACSQAPLSPTPSTLTPQFGTVADDAANQLAVGESGIYIGGIWNSKPSLIKFGRAGNIPWVKRLGGWSVDVALDSRNNAYILYYSTANHAQYSVRKYTSGGALVWQRQLANPAGTAFTYYASDVDAHDNLYLSFATYGSAGKTELRKYRPDGTLLYGKQVAGVVNDLAVTPDGTAYTVSEVQQQLIRYTPQGQRVWRKALPMAGNEVAVGASSKIYVAGHDPSYAGGRILLAKYSSDGSKNWQRVVQEGFFTYLEGLDADTKGNVFVGVNYREDPRGDRDVYFHSFNAAGTRLAQRTFNFSYDDSLAGIGVLSATEVYLAGTTYSDVDGEDGFVLRLNGLTGSVTWQR